jgi:hypothetical protein
MFPDIAPSDEHNPLGPVGKPIDTPFLLNFEDVLLRVRIESELHYHVSLTVR